MKQFKCLLIADFNIANLAGYLNNLEQPPEIAVEMAPYGNVIQSLMGEKESDHNILFVWTLPQSISGAFGRAMNFEHISPEDVLKEVDAFCSILLQAAQKTDYIFIPQWVLPTYYRGYGLIDMKEGVGLAHLLNEMNMRFKENLKGSTNVFVLNTNKWIESAGKNAFNPKLWYMAKIAFSNEVFHLAALDIQSACRTVSGQNKKFIIVDLDDTLWGGILGDDGIENLKLGGHDPIGEALADFQKSLKALTRKGILLGIASKNDEELALKAIGEHPEMILKKADFAGWRINWKDKAQNIVDLVADLNIGLQTVVFIDDNPVERARVREALPEVFVPDWPQDKMLFTSALQELSCFDSNAVSQEDINRTAMYASERERKDLKLSVGSYEDWLKTLEINVRVEALDEVNRQRVLQLLNKTNQMNLATRRLTENGLDQWAAEDGHWMWAVRVSDRFGDSGLSGILSLDVNGHEGKIADFVLSCRVMGRKIEETMLNVLTSYGKALDLKQLSANFVETPKNKPCYEFWNNSGFSHNPQTNEFTWDLDKEYEVPVCIKLEKSSLIEA